MGRPRKFKLSDIVTDIRNKTFVVVDHRLRGYKSEYNVVPIDGRHKRYGRSAWTGAEKLFSAGKRSKTGAIMTYRANKLMEDERGCDCQCCIHVAYDRDGYNHITGEDQDE